MSKRDLSFRNFDEVLAEVERLHRGGYTKLGNWDLAQCCDHIGFFAKDSMDGPRYSVPWIFRVLFGKIALKRIFAKRQMKANIPTPQKPLPPPGADEAAAVEAFSELIRRFANHANEFHPSPFFGRLTPEEWRELVLIHSAHHLGFLLPK